MYVKSMYPDVPNIPPQNVHNLMFRRPEQKEWKNYTLHIDAVTGKKRSYREFYERVIDGATALGYPVSEKGLALKAEDGEIVGIVGENSMDFIVLVHSLLAVAVPFAMFPHYATSFELAHAIRLSKATRIFVQPQFFTAIQKASKDVGFPDDHIHIFEGRIRGRWNFDEMIHQVRKDYIPRLAVRPAGKDTLAYLIFSSGTSGLPKAVMISHGNLCFSLLQSMVIVMQEAKVYTPPKFSSPEGLPVSLAFLPMHHTMGLHTFCFRSFLKKSTLVLLPMWNIDVALKLIPKYKITHLSLVPSIVHQLATSPKTEEADMGSIASISCGASYLPDSLTRRLARLAPKNTVLSEGYGLSEATIGLCFKPMPGVLDGRGKRVPGSVGILLPGIEARILREDGSDADPNEPGELWVKAENVALGYWNNEKANRETFIDGWLKTGDRFVVDTDGNFYFQDRAKDTLKISGIQVSPVEIENVLLAHPDGLIIDVTVAGVSGGRTSDEKVPRAWVVLSAVGKQKDEAATVEALHAWTKENLSPYKWLRGGIEVINEIPKSPTGKVLRRVLQDGYEQRIKEPSAKL